MLFVAEKRAALDVVKKRLENVGLGELSLDIHDKAARPAAVRAQIKHALELRLSHDADLLKTKLQVAESSDIAWPATPTGCTSRTRWGNRCTPRGLRSWRRIRT